LKTRHQEYEGGDEHPDYENLKQQFLNLQAAQRNINKKADENPAPYSETKVQLELSQLRQGELFLII
jgi:hypothetical protein